MQCLAQGGTISFTPLNDTPSAITPNGVLIGNNSGTELVQKTLSAGTGISIDNTSPNCNNPLLIQAPNIHTLIFSQYLVDP